MTVRGVLAIGETDGDRLAPITAELVSAALTLAKECDVALISASPDAAKEAAALGATRVHLLTHPLLGTYQPDLWLAALEQACRKLSPAIVLVGRTEMGRELAPRLAFRLGVGLLQDCVRLSVDVSGRLVGQRPVYGGNVLATVASVGTPQVATVRPKVYPVAPSDHSRTGAVVSLPVELSPEVARTRVIETVREAATGEKLEEAKVVVAGGRGIGSAEGFRQLEALASLLGGAVGASRPAVDAGWVSYSTQIGLTGRSVSPELYIAVAISGASQHLAGCSGAKNIVAINKDSGAGIFREARYGVVGDWRQVLPAFAGAVAEIKQKRGGGL